MATLLAHAAEETILPLGRVRPAGGSLDYDEPMRLDPDELTPEEEAAVLRARLETRTR